MTKPPILVTGAAGRIGRTLAQLLLAKGHAVRAMVRRDDDRAKSLRETGVEVIVGDLRDLDAMHRAIAGCESVYFGMSVSEAYLEATVNVAAVAKHHGVRAFVNMSQMTLAQMSVYETTSSPQHKLHWLAEQALNWSGLPVVHVRPTVFLDGFFFRVIARDISTRNELRLPFGTGKTSPIAVSDVAEVIARVLDDPTSHLGKILHLTGPVSEDMNFYAAEYSRALGRTINYVDIPVEEWKASLIERGLPTHLVSHMLTMSDMHREGRYDRLSDGVQQVTGRLPTSLFDFVKLNAEAYSSQA
ncbi:SDR family NAD(P)-dependent oxidoreductase [Paraburkholderia caribensis]|uniref:SDR family NAD(P)-dependent oxidoreductase n=1 Tax=Paraburkholderia caribensis TaxID=75105 RepID=UPI001CB61ABC|nr:SDR family NAD(P)-dependent oxidoreductase [Paraburkholderia caribensis]CAG9249374.1 putative NAD(P)H dehydrogenase (quinone) [Paraburkholderia caribensis]